MLIDGYRWQTVMGAPGTGKSTTPDSPQAAAEPRWSGGGSGSQAKRRRAVIEAARMSVKQRVCEENNVNK